MIEEKDIKCIDKDDDEDFKCIVSHIEKFAISTDDSYLIPFELTKQTRSNVHRYVNAHFTGIGITSEGITLLGSANKKILLKRVLIDELSKLNESSNLTPKMRKPTDDEINMFISYTNIPIPCHHFQHIEYFIELYDKMYGSIAKWKQFVQEIQTMSLKKEADSAMGRICSTISQNNEYKEMMKQVVKGPGERFKKDVYRISSIGKYFVSVDVRQGNFTMLCDKCPNIFRTENGLMTWFDFVKQFTKSDFIAKSKFFREICFGRMGFSKRSNTLLEIYIDNVHKKIEEWSTHNEGQLVLRMKAGDELVYELPDHDSFLNLLDSLKETLGDNLNNLHIRVFKVEQIEQKNYFLKTFSYNTDWSRGDKDMHSMIEFKCVPKSFMPQIIKWLNHEKIEDRDLLFMHDGILCGYHSTIFDQ